MKNNFYSKHIYSLIILFFLLISKNSIGQVTYTSSNFYYFTGLEIGNYEINSNTFENDEFGQRIYNQRKFNSQQVKIGLGYNYNRSSWFSFGMEFDFGFGLPKENSYEYMLDYSSEIETFKAKDRMNFFSFSYLMDFGLTGDLESTDFTLCISPNIGIQGGWFKSEIIDDWQNIAITNTEYENRIHRNAEDGIGKEKLFTFFAKIGPSFQYGFSKFGMIYGAAKYAFAYSGSENNNIKRRNWIDLDFGIKFILN